MCSVTEVMSDSLRAHEHYSPPGSSVHGILRQESWSTLPFPPPGDPPNLGNEAESLESPELAGGFFTIRTT